MTDTSVYAVQAGVGVDREALRAELEATRQAFHDRLAAVSGAQWRQKYPGSAWTVAEVFTHLTWSVEYLPQEVESARRGKGMFNMPRPLRDPLSYWYMRLLARNSTPDSVRRRYDAAMDATLKALETVPDSDWNLSANFYGEGRHTVAQLFRTPAHHLAEHTAELAP